MQAKHNLSTSRAAQANRLYKCAPLPARRVVARAADTNSEPQQVQQKLTGKKVFLAGTFCGQRSVVLLLVPFSYEEHRII